MADDITINIVDNPVNVTIGLSTTPDNFQVSAFPNAAFWGNIIGTLSAQTDLWAYLSAETFSPSQLTAFLNSNNISLCSINVNGQILSAGIDLFDIFLTTETDSQTLSYTPSSYLLSISNGNTVNLSSINSLFGSVSGKYEDVYSNVVSNSANWDTAFNISTAYQQVSSTFLTTETDSQTLTYSPSSIEVSISNGNTVTLNNLITKTQALAYSIAL